MAISKEIPYSIKIGLHRKYFPWSEIFYELFGDIMILILWKKVMPMKPMFVFYIIYSLESNFE